MQGKLSRPMAISESIVGNARPLVKHAGFRGSGPDRETRSRPTL